MSAMTPNEKERAALKVACPFCGCGKAWCRDPRTSRLAQRLHKARLRAAGVA